jgi:hypothetical protein
MVLAIHGFVIWILKTLLGQSFILLLPLPLFSSITGVAEVVVKLVLRSEPLHVLTVDTKVLQFALFNNLILTVVSKGMPSLLTQPTLITHVGHDVCDLAFH